MYNNVDVLSTGCTSSERLWWSQVRPKSKQWDNIPAEVALEDSNNILEFLEYMATAKKNKVTVAPKTAPTGLVKKQFPFPKAATFWLADVKFNRQTVLGLPFALLPQVILTCDHSHIFKSLEPTKNLFTKHTKAAGLEIEGLDDWYLYFKMPNAK